MLTDGTTDATSDGTTAGFVDATAEAADAALRSTLADTSRRLVATRIDTPGSARMLEAVVTGALVAVPHAAAVSVALLDRRGALNTLASSDAAVSEADQVHTERGEGPGVDACGEGLGEVTDAPDLSSGAPWPAFASAALDAGFAAVLSIPLWGAGAGRAVGAVTFYGCVAHCFCPRDRLCGTLFVAQAAVALTGARRAGELNQALSSRDVIGRAKGILMERFRIEDTRAFAMLVESSQHTNIKLHDVATWVVTESERTYNDEHTAQVPATPVSTPSTSLPVTG